MVCNLLIFSSFYLINFCGLLNIIKTIVNLKYTFTLNLPIPRRLQLKQLRVQFWVRH